MKTWKLIAFLLFSVVCPCAYICIRFNVAENTVKLNLAGIIVIAIVISVLSVFVKFYLEGLKTKYSFIKQILTGLLKVIAPLVIALLVLIFLGDNIQLIKEALFVIIPCETIAIVVNPLPKWCFDNNVEGLSEIADKIFKGKDKTE